MDADGSSVVTKHPNTGGLVTVRTVTEQLLYEIDSPDYLGPDVVARFDTIELMQDAPDRVRVAGVRGGPPPATVKVSTNSLGGFRNSVSFVLCGLDIAAKAQVVQAAMAPVLDGVRDVQWGLVRLDQPDAASEEQASALLRCQVKDGDPGRIGRPFSAAAVEMALASYPGFTLTSPPADAAPIRRLPPGLRRRRGGQPHGAAARRQRGTYRRDTGRGRPTRVAAGRRRTPGRPPPASRPPLSVRRWAWLPAPGPGTRAERRISVSGRVPTTPTPGLSATSASSGSSTCCLRPAGCPCAATSCPICEH